MNEVEQYKKLYEEIHGEPFPSLDDQVMDEFIPTCVNGFIREFGYDEAINICNLIWEQR